MSTVNIISILDISKSYKNLSISENIEQLKSIAYSASKRIKIYSNISNISVFLLIILLVIIFFKLTKKNNIWEIIKINYLFLILTVALNFMKQINLFTQYMLILFSLLATVTNIWKIFHNTENKNGNTKNKDISTNNSINGHIIFKVFALFSIFMLNIFMWLYFINKEYNLDLTEKANKIKENIIVVKNENEEIENKNISQNNISNDYEIIAGYKYKKNNGNISKFSKRSLGYEQNLIGVENQYQAYADIKIEYCRAVNEIIKVDKNIVPGTNKPFTEATYIEVDDAYKEYLQKIAQIRQVVILAIINEDMENEVGCYYKGTHWNNANSQYKAKQFYSDEIDNYYNNYGN